MARATVRRSHAIRCLLLLLLLPGMSVPSYVNRALSLDHKGIRALVGWVKGPTATMLVWSAATYGMKNRKANVQRSMLAMYCMMRTSSNDWRNAQALQLTRHSPSRQTYRRCHEGSQFARFPTQLTHTHAPPPAVSSCETSTYRDSLCNSSCMFDARTTKTAPPSIRPRSSPSMGGCGDPPPRRHPRYLGALCTGINLARHTHHRLASAPPFLAIFLFLFLAGPQMKKKSPHHTPQALTLAEGRNTCDSHPRAPGHKRDGTSQRFLLGEGASAASTSRYFWSSPKRA